MPEKPAPNPADHAEDFARRYADELELVAGELMLNLGLPDHQIGALDHERGSEHHCFFPRSARVAPSATPGR